MDLEKQRQLNDLGQAEKAERGKIETAVQSIYGQIGVLNLHEKDDALATVDTGLIARRALEIEAAREEIAKIKAAKRILM